MIDRRTATRIGRVTVATLLAGTLTACGAGTPARPSTVKAPDGQTLQAFRYTTITADDKGVSRFTGGMIRFDYEDYAPPAAPLGVSDTASTKTLAFLTYPVGWVGDWHPAPRSLFVFILAGRVEVEVGNGEKRAFGPGDVILAMDTEGRGHISRTLGDKPAISAVVALGD